MRVSLKKLVRGALRRALTDVCGLTGSPLQIVDDDGVLVLGDASATGESHDVLVGDTRIGAVLGGAGADRIAKLVSQMCEREDEKLALAEETLGRYKELTLLYTVSDKLSHVLEVTEVARMIVDEARAFLGASGVSLMLLDRRRNVLEAVASTDDRPRLVVATSGVEGRVLRTGRAELIEDLTTTDMGPSEPGVTSMMAAPLRTGETVFGLLRVTTAERTPWTAGHLKLVTSLASNAAAAISHAMLHRERLRQQALRHQIERFVSPEVLEAAFGGVRPDGERGAVALFCDATELTQHADPSIPHERLVDLVLRATTASAGILIRHGATVQISQAELVVALFVSPSAELADAAEAAVRAATEIVRALDRRFGGFTERPPSIAITHAQLPATEATSAFFAAVGAAAGLQTLADGRIVLDEHVASALGAELRGGVSELAIRGDDGTRMYEVHQ